MPAQFVQKRLLLNTYSELIWEFTLESVLLFVPFAVARSTNADLCWCIWGFILENDHTFVLTATKRSLKTVLWKSTCEVTLENDLTNVNYVQNYVLLLEVWEYTWNHMQTKKRRVFLLTVLFVKSKSGNVTWKNTSLALILTIVLLFALHAANLFRLQELKQTQANSSETGSSTWM